MRRDLAGLDASDPDALIYEATRPGSEQCASPILPLSRSNPPPLRLHTAPLCPNPVTTAVMAGDKTAKLERAKKAKKASSSRSALPLGSFQGDWLDQNFMTGQ